MIEMTGLAELAASDSSPRRVRILREAGGMGDVVRTFPVAREFKRRNPGCEVHYFGLAGYRSLVELCPDVDCFHPVEISERRRRDTYPDEKRYPYLRTGLKFDRTADLWCPAYRYEKKAAPDVVLDRTDCFLKAAGFRDVPCRIPVIRVDAAARGWAEGFLAGAGVHRKRPVMALHPFSTTARRNWQPAKRWLEVAERLRSRGVQTIVFHSVRYARAGRAELDLRVFPGIKAVSLGFPQLAALLNLCDMLLSVDSGLFHLAAALSLPAVGLFGPTSGRVMRKHFPRHDYIECEDGECRCRKPCFLIPAGGYDARKCSSSCARLDAIGVERVLERTLEALEAGGCRRVRRE